MKHIRVTDNKLVNPDRFDAIRFEPAAHGEPARVVFVGGLQDITVKGEDAERAWEQLKAGGDELERRMAAFAQIEAQQRDLLATLGLVERSLREYAAIDEGGGEAT